MKKKSGKKYTEEHKSCQFFEEFTKTISKTYTNLRYNSRFLTSNSKGITLIALIITIIVMIILVGVTISVAINEGLFEKAREAKTKTEEQIDIEQKWAEGRVQIEGKWYDSIDDYFEGKVSKKTGPLGDAIDVTDYGKKVTNYKSKNYPDLVWRLFYKDKNNVYLISETTEGDYPVTRFSFYDYDETSDTYTKKDIIEKYNSGADVSTQGQDLMPLAKAANLFTTDNKNENIIATAYLCDTSDEGPWEGYRDAEGKAVWAMGGPTIELFVKSYNASQNKTAILTANTNGYSDAGLTNENTFMSEMNKGIYRLKTTGWWWLAAPSSGSNNSVRFINDSSGYLSNNFVNGNYSARPIVCISQYQFGEFILE